jgi:hypothetical protein
MSPSTSPTYSLGLAVGGEQQLAGVREGGEGLVEAAAVLLQGAQEGEGRAAVGVARVTIVDGEGLGGARLGAGEVAATAGDLGEGDVAVGQLDGRGIARRVQP